MLYSKVVIAAFLGLLQAVTAAPIDARIDARGGSSPAKNPKGSGPGTVSVLSGNNDDGLVLGSGNGGMGGTNYDSSGAEALTEVISEGGGLRGGGSWSGGGKGGGTPSVITNAGNSVKQQGNGGDGSAVGTYGSNNKFHSRGQSKSKGPQKGKPHDMMSPPTNPSVSVLSNDNNDGLVVASGNGGPGGENIADPTAIADTVISSEGGSSGGLPSVFNNAGNSVKQGGNGGDGSAVGTYGSNNKFESRGQSTKPQQGPSSPGSISVLSNDNDDGATILSGNGGAGGINFADPFAEAYSETDTSSPSGGGSPIGCRTESCSAPKKGGPKKQPSGGQPITITNAGNNVKQGGNGGSGSAVGSYGSDNTFKARTSSQPPASNDPSISVLSNDNDDGIVAASGNGGPGGMNIAYPDAYADSSVLDGTSGGGIPIGCRSGSCSPKGGPHKQPSGGSPVIITNAGNKVKQGGNGGSGAAVGSYGSNNHF